MNTPVYLSLHLLLEVGLFPLSDYCDCNVCWVTNLFESLFLILLSVYLGVELLNHVIILCLAFWGTAWFSTVAVPFYISSSFVQGFQFLHVLVNTGYLCLFFKNYSYLSRCEVVLTVVLIFISLLTRVLSIFSCAYWHFVYPLWRNIHANLLPIKKKWKYS